MSRPDSEFVLLELDCDDDGGVFVCLGGELEGLVFDVLVWIGLSG